MTPATHHMRILMLGNSLTTAHDLPHILEAEFDAEVRVHARGGARLAEHLNPKTKLGANTTTALRDESWDVVVLQEMSHGAATSPHAYLRSVTALCDAILAQHATPRYRHSFAQIQPAVSMTAP